MLEAKGKEVVDTKAMISSTATAISNQRDATNFTVQAAERAVSVVLDDIGLDDDDLYILTDIDRIRLEALNAIRSLLYP